MTRPPAPLDSEGFRLAAGVPRETVSRLLIYANLLQRWQRRINLVSATTLDDLWRRHMLDSAQLAQHIPADSRVILDIGSGAGFPGLVLAIVGGWQVHLVEADTRKAAFLREAARLTEADVVLHVARIETMSGFPADVVTARACAPLIDLIGYAHPFLYPRSRCLFLKGRSVEAELTLARETWNMTAALHGSATDSSGVLVVIEGIPYGRPSPGLH